MDLLEALRSFRAVAHERSFTRGAERCGQPQPVASRRIAALERRLGVTLLLRTSRRVELTPEGERLLPLAEEVLAGFERVDRLFSGTAPALVLAVPSGLEPRARAAIRRGVPDLSVVFVEDDPVARSEALQTGTAHLALLPVAPDAGEIQVPLGVADPEGPARERFALGRLRRSVTERDLPPRALHLLAEDDVPAVRDPLVAAAYAAGLRADQVRIGTSYDEAWTRVHQWDDVVVTTAALARRESVAWSRLDRPSLHRSYRLAGEDRSLGPDLRDALLRRLAEGLGGRSAADDAA